MAELRVPQIDFSVLGGLRDDYVKARKQGQRDFALANLPMNPDGTVNAEAASAALLRAGATDEGVSFANLANTKALRDWNMKRDERDHNFRVDETQRNQRNADRDYYLKASTANQADIREVKNADGSTSLVRIDRSGNSTPINTGPEKPAANPFAPPGKTTDEQAKAAGYGTRMAQSHKIITDLENINERPLGYTEAAIQNIPGANLFLSADRQKVNQAQRDFINAILRRESGAVISESEFASARQQYFPQPGDSAAVIEQKRQNRITATQGIMAAAGQNYQPPADFARNNPNPNRTQQNVQQQQPQVSEGAIIVNPQTGERRQLRGGQWLPVQ